MQEIAFLISLIELVRLAVMSGDTGAWVALILSIGVAGIVIISINLKKNEP